ncbi:hypothetical protein DFH28DRAFT_973941 [Melampsora americana]|nr:hypothetical protein DFH28DRAFT_973941 [Melampsora americana]
MSFEEQTLPNQKTRSTEPWNSRCKNHQFTPFRPTNPSDHHHSPPPPQPQGLSETNLRQTRLSETFNQKPFWTDPPKRRRSDDEASTFTSRGPISQLKLISRTKPTSIRTEEHDSKKHAQDEVQHFQVFTDQKAHTSRRKARSSEPFGRSRISSNSHQHLDNINRCKSIVMSETVKKGHLIKQPQRIGGMNRSEVIETQNHHLTVNQEPHPTISFDTIEPLHTSSPSTTPSVSPIPQQTLFSLGIDLHSQCSPLSYQVLHSKDQIRSVNRAHGAWLEATKATQPDEAAAFEDHLLNRQSGPITKQSRHRLVSKDFVRLSGNLNTSPSQNKAIDSVIATNTQDCDTTIPSIQMDLSTDQHDLESQLDRERTQHTPKSRVLCEASPTPPKKLSSQAKEDTNRIGLFNLEPYAKPTHPIDQLSPWSLRSRSPLGDQTQELSPERVSKRHDPLSKLIEGSPGSPSHVVLAEDTQENSSERSSKRTQSLTESSDHSPDRKHLIRSLAPPTPISVRMRQQEELSALREKRTHSRPVVSGRVTGSDESPYESWTPSTLKKVKRICSYQSHLMPENLGRNVIDKLGVLTQRLRL